MATESETPCPICKLDTNKFHVWDHGERISLECDRCGKFTITMMAARKAESLQLGPKLSAWIRERSETGCEMSEINLKMLQEIEAALPNYRVSEKQLLLLRAFERRTAFPGQAIDVIPLLDYPLAWASNEDEFKYLLTSLVERRLVCRTNDQQIEIASDGWGFLDEHARPAVISDQVFVAMSFAPELQSAWESGIRDALIKAQFRPYRIDAEPHIDRIDTKIITEIKNSRFLVADVTQQRPGVYFEAGYALGLGLPVFWCVRADDLKNVHFDTRQYNHIVWECEQHLAEQLFLFVSALIRKPK